MEPNRAGCVSFPREWTRFYLLGLSVLLLFVFTGRTAFAAGERLALVIGNSNYAALSSLKNPHNDAREVAARLGEQGFTLIDGQGRETRGAVYDLDEDDLVKALKSFASAAQRSEIAFIYYAGHGMQIDGESYLLPVNVKPWDIEILQRNSLRLNRALKYLEGKAELTVAVFDACRDIPELNAVQRGTRGGGFDRGTLLVDNVQTRDSGRIVAFAGSPGEAVLDADRKGNHSPYTKILLEHIGKPGADILDMFRGVSNEFGDFYHQQAPEVVTRGTVKQGHYCIAEPCRGTHEPAPGTHVAAAQTDSRKEMLAWGMAYSKDSCEGYKDFLELFPDSVFAGLAESKKERLCTQPTPTDADDVAWQQAIADGGCSALEDYLRRFPSGRHVAVAQERRFAACKKPEDEEWEKTVSNGTCEAYYAYYKAFPQSRHAAKARDRLKQCREQIMRQLALEFVDKYYGSLGHDDCDAVAAMWVSPPSRLCSMLKRVQGFKVRNNELVSMEGNDASVYVDVVGQNRGEAPRSWEGCLDLAWNGERWELVHQHAENDGPCAARTSR